MVIPAEGVGLLYIVRQGAEHLGVGLGGLKALDIAVTGEEAINGLHSSLGPQVSNILISCAILKDHL